MKTDRRHWMMSMAGVAASRAAASGQDQTELRARLVRLMEEPVLRTDLLREPLKIESLELLRSGAFFLVRVRAAGLTGFAEAHSAVMRSAYPIFLQRVAPYFLGKDARELERVFHEAYLAGSNYKWQGLPFWVCMAAAEIAILDLLGRACRKPIGELFGKVRRRHIAVYRASGNRGNSPEAEIEYLRRITQETGAKAIKFRLGARMRYTEASTRRDLQLIPLVRKTFGKEMTLYVDANGSYDVPMALRIGRLLEERGYAFFEEPVPFDYYDETRAIADALEIPIALGEEEMSLRNFRRIIETGTAQVIQPDLLYGGGLMRGVKVARMANAAGLPCTPHMSGGGLGYLYVAHFASCVEDAGPHQEYKGEEDTLPVECASSSLRSENGILTVPSGPGLGVEVDSSVWKRAVPVSA
ncbi:MAG: mandelate racemase/muconate lactonizing enzyme family protein [Bryobacteraceae bacterium]